MANINVLMTDWIVNLQASRIFNKLPLDSGILRALGISVDSQNFYLNFFCLGFESVKNIFVKKY